MTHDELLEEINTAEHPWWMQDGLRAVVQLHKPVLHSKYGTLCEGCNLVYPCDTIDTIEKELNG